MREGAMDANTYRTHAIGFKITRYADFRVHQRSGHPWGKGQSRYILCGYICGCRTPLHFLIEEETNKRNFFKENKGI